MLLFYIPDIPRLISAYVKYTSKKVNSYGRMACMGKTTYMILLKLIINGNVRCYDRNFILNVHRIQSIITAGLLPCCRVKTIVTNKALTSKKKRHTVFLKNKRGTRTYVKALEIQTLFSSYLIFAKTILIKTIYMYV